MEKLLIKGQVGLWVAITMAVGSITAAGITGWFSAANAVSSRVGTVEIEVGKVKATGEAQFAQIQLQLKDLKDGQDKLLNLFLKR